MEPRCEDCVFSDPDLADDGETLLLLCKRFPPTVFVLDGIPSQTRPTMSGDDHCGEFVAKMKTDRKHWSSGAIIPYWDE